MVSLERAVCERPPHVRETSYGTVVGFLEVKTPTGRQSDRQKHFQDLCEQHGIPYKVVRSVEDVEKYMEEMK